MARVRSRSSSVVAMVSMKTAGKKKESKDDQIVQTPAEAKAQAYLSGHTGGSEVKPLNPPAPVKTDAQLRQEFYGQFYGPASDFSLSSPHHDNVHPAVVPAPQSPRH